MGKFTDIHTHILPGVDDGSETMEMSIHMLHIAQENGIDRIILTPHFKPMHHNISPDRLKGVLENLKKASDREGINLKLCMGNELYYHSGLLEELEKAKACTMADSMYVLVEFGPMDAFDYIRNGIYEMMSGGFRPILAHAERYCSILSQIVKVDDLIKMGCYIQINADSVMGKTGTREKHFTRQLLKRRLVHFVATDAHSDGKRGPYLAECAKYIEKKCGQAYMHRLLCENPGCVMENKYIQTGR